MINGARNKHHRQRFSRALCVPDDATAFLRFSLCFEAFDDFPGCAVLLVARDYFDGVTFTIRAKDGVGMDEIEQGFAMKHPLNEHLLAVDHIPAFSIDLREAERVGVFPLDIIIELACDAIVVKKMI